jgi:ankyrin repeat protein
MGADQLFDAVRKVTLRDVKECLDADVEPNVQNQDGWTPTVHRAAFEGHTNTVSSLLDRGGLM